MKDEEDACAEHYSNDREPERFSLRYELTRRS
jgi:hypothetical protein